MYIINAPSLEEGASQALDLCRDGPRMNVAINAKVELEAIDTPWLEAYGQLARQWQSPSTPRTLKFNHGQYIFRHGDALAYVEKELGRKPTSNRACISLVDSGDIMTSEDGRLPSFLVVQVGFQPDSQETLYISAYFRALEVSSFLPINLAELALLAHRLSVKFPTVSNVDFTLFAFRAHYVPGFDTHELALLDQATPAEIEETLDRGDMAQVAKWLKGKQRHESIITPNGLACLAGAIHTRGDLERLGDAIDLVIADLSRIETARRSGTHGRTLEVLQDTADRHLSDAVSEALKGAMKRGTI